MGWLPNRLPAIGAARAGLFADHNRQLPWWGLRRWPIPEYLIDVHAIAVIDR